MWHLRPVSLAGVPGWQEDDHGQALAAFARHGQRPGPKRYRTGKAGIDPETLEPLFRAAASSQAQSDPKGFFETHFDACLVIGDGERGLVTAFYEPEIEAAAEPDCLHSTPFHRRPADLVAVNDSSRPQGWCSDIRFARQDSQGVLEPYPDRKAINDGYLAGRGLEIAFADPVDVFFAHVQGAARLRFADGSFVRITYDGKSGHPFTGIGKLLMERGVVSPRGMGMQVIREWLAANPERAKSVMEENRSYIFFRETNAGDLSIGPIAAAKVPLTAERSLAVDRLLHTFGTPVFVKADEVNSVPWAKLMIAQDTGSAIVGPARGDLFMGSGDCAGELAGNVKSAADFYILVPKTARIETQRPVEA